MNIPEFLAGKISELIPSVTHGLAEDAAKIAASLPPDIMRIAATEFLIIRAKDRWRDSNLNAARLASSYLGEQTPSDRRGAAAHGPLWRTHADADLTRELDAKTESMFRDFRSGLKSLAASMHIEWSPDILQAGFAIGDKTTATWGNATQEQHQARIDMLLKHSFTEFETAARHQRAIDDLVASGRKTLAEAFSASDAA